MSLTIEPIWSWSVVAVVACLVFGVVIVTYPARLRGLPVFQRRVLFGLRLFAALLLVLAMLRPAVTFTETTDDKPVLVILADASRSMGTPDGPGGSTRREALLETLAEHDDAIADFAEKAELLRFDYGEALAMLEAETDFAPEAEADRTAIGKALARLLEETRGRTVVGVVLLGDGAQRAVPPDDEDPRVVAEKFGDLGIPIYTVGFGGSGIGDSVFDVAVDELLVNPVEFERKVVPVQARIRALGAAGRELRLQLLIEDRRDKRIGESGEMRPAPASRNAQPELTITPTTNDETLIVELSFLAERPGEFKVGVQAEPLDGELKTTNNRRETILTVRRGGIRIAYFDKLRPEMHFLRRVNTDEQVQLDFRLIRFFPRVTEIEDEFFEPGAYDAYIIGDVPAAAFGGQNLDRLAARVRDGAGLLMTGGYVTFGPGGYAGTPLERFLPVRLEGRQQDPAAPINTTNHREQPLRMIPTRRGLQNYVMRLDTPDRNEDHWRELAPMEGANLLKPANEAVEVLAETPDGLPLLFLQEWRPARVMVLAADTTYQWVLHGFEEEHQRFWRQMILFLTRKELEGDQPVWARVDPRNFSPGQRVELQVGAQTEEGIAIPEATFEVVVENPEGRETELPTRERSAATVADFLETAAPGDYWVRVTGRVDGKLHGDATTRFIVDQRDLELDNPAADPGLLREIAQRTGGSFVLPEELGSQLVRLREEGLMERTIQNVTRTTLWDNWWFLGLFVGLMTLEWFVRKRRGLV